LKSAKKLEMSASFELFYRLIRNSLINRPLLAEQKVLIVV